MDILAQWQKCLAFPFGKKIFQYMIGRTVPYTGSIQPFVENLAKGHAVVKMKDRNAIRNHLNSIHAVALINLGECTTGFAVVASLNPKTQQAILRKLEIEYLKKSRGTVTAECVFKEDVTRLTESQDFWLEAHIKDSAGQTTAIAKALWRVGLKKPRS